MTILTSLACVITATGISRPSYADILETMQAKFKAIYGTDAYMDPDSQDGQMLAIICKGYDDANAAAVAIYNSFSPATATGDALSKNVKINGISRAVATHSSVNLLLGGTAGTLIEGGVVSDDAGNRWLLPAEVVIGAGGTVTVTATAEEPGDIEALAGTITNIETPVLGWQTVTNSSEAAPGAPVESDATLRKRQAVSVALPSLSIKSGIEGAVRALEGVTQARIYENDTSVADSNGIPGHSIAAVVLGGDSTEIAETLMRKKGPGCGTDGTTSVAVTDPGGNAMTIKFYVPTAKRILVALTIKALSGYVSTTGDEIKAAVAAHINALGIGKKVDLLRIALPAQLHGGAGSETFELDAVSISIHPAAPAAADVAIAFNELAECDVADITLTVT